MTNDDMTSGEGEFTPSSEQLEPSTQPDAGHDGQPDGAPPSGYVPQKALHAARNENSELRRRLDQQDRDLAEFRGFMNGSKKPAEPEKPVTFWENPEEFTRRLITEQQKPLADKATAIEGRVDHERLNRSEFAASQEFGADATKAALEAAKEASQSNPAFQFEYRRIMASAHPWRELVIWHKHQSVLSRFGDDPDAAFEAEVERRLQARLNGETIISEPSSRAQQPKPKMPTNFAGGSRNGAPRTTRPATGVGRSLGEIMGR